MKRVEVKGHKNNPNGGLVHEPGVDDPSTNNEGLESLHVEWDMRKLERMADAEVK